MDIDELIAREAVRDLIARYNANADTGRFDEVVELFAPDAVLALPDEVHEGRDAIAAMFRGVRDRVIASAPTGVTPHLRHYTSTLQIDVDDAAHARSRCYFAVLMPHGLDHWGRYVDEFVCADGTWRFARRTVTTDGRREGGSALD
jgi:uncharacterized protein (TIGR02246 family)